MTVPTQKICQNCKNSFIIESEDFAFYEKIHVPPPTFCVECRQQRRAAFRNEQALYKRKCGLCGKDVITRFSPENPHPMYCQPCWWSDKWDPLSYGKNYDFTKPFFQQFKELMLRVPHISLFSIKTVNSEWVNNESDDKNCYLNVGGHFNEDSAYNTYELKGRNSFDNYWLVQGELCYENIQCERCYKTYWSEQCFDCQEIALSFDCHNCSYILGCAGLRHKQYCIFNKQHTKESYAKFLEDNFIESCQNLENLKTQAYQVWRLVPHRDRLVLKSNNVTGNFITESRNAYNCWNAEQMEYCKNLYIALHMKDSYDGTSIAWSELIYEGAHSGGLYNSKFFAHIFGGANVLNRNASFLEYCYTIPSSNNCFGCVNLRQQEYCILNKKYPKKEYEVLIPKIKKHMQDMPYIDGGGRKYGYGEFFPIELSPFAYNETLAQDLYPLKRGEAIKNGYTWSDFESKIAYAFSDYEIPDDIRNVGDDILKKVLKCEISGKAYRVIPMELEFYRKIGIPIPHRSPLQRHKDRMAKLLPWRWYERICQCAGSVSENGLYKNTSRHAHGNSGCVQSIQTPYAPERPEIIYCESCYNSEVV